MESQVKERIVGAAVLVALGVWLIPWVLDGPEIGTPETEPVAAIALPGADEAGPLRTATIELSPGRITGPPAARAAGEAPDTNAVSDPGDDAADSAAAVSAVADAGAAAADDAATAAPPAEAESTRAAANAAADAAPPAAPSESPPPVLEGWTVQLGAFSDAANARQLAARVSDFGYSAHVYEYFDGNRTMHRVRLGGFDTRATASAAASSLSAHGFRTQVMPAE